MQLRYLAMPALLGAICCAAPPAVAIDGEILISNSAAINTGIGSGDTAGYPITIDRAGSYKLTSPLLPKDRNAFNVIASDVTINLNNFHIAFSTDVIEGAAVASRAGPNHGISAATALRLTVRNGAILNFSGSAIHNPNGGAAIVENMRLVSNNSYGVVLGDNSRVEDSTILNNGNSGISLGDGGVARHNELNANARLVGNPNLRCGARCLVDGNVVMNAVLGGGVSVEAGSLVIGNVIAGNKGTGLSGSSAGGTGTGANNTPAFTNNAVTANGSTSGGILSAHPNHCRPDNQFCD